MNGGYIFLAFIALMLIGLIYGFYTRKGSAINQRPQGAEKGASPGVGQGKSRISAGEDETEGVPDTHGAR